MFRSLLAIAGSCLAAGTLHAELHWDKPAQQFHRTPQDKFVETKYTFKNTGTATINVENVRTSCGCTTADLDKRTYAPGEQGEITVKFNYASRVGPQRKTIRVFTSDKGNEPTVLDLIVFIEEPLKITPALVFWRTGEPGDAKMVQIAANPEHPVKVKSVTSSNPRVVAALQTIKAGEQYAVSVKPTDTASKETAEVSVVTDYPPDAPKTYTIHARIK